MLPKLPRDAGDRNRTSPFAFTGNKFEFRAVSANQSIALPNVALNVAVAESLDYCATELEKGLKEGKKLQVAVKGAAHEADQGQQADHLQRQQLRRRVAEGRRKARAAQPPTSVDAFGEILKPDVIKAFEKYGVLNERELKARYEVALEQYNKTINIEAQLMVLMANRYILPAAYRFAGELAQSVAAVKAAGVTAKEAKKTLETCRS